MKKSIFVSILFIHLVGAQAQSKENPSFFSSGRIFYLLTVPPALTALSYATKEYYNHTKYNKAAKGAKEVAQLPALLEMVKDEPAINQPQRLQQELLQAQERDAERIAQDLEKAKQTWNQKYRHLRTAQARLAKGEDYTFDHPNYEQFHDELRRDWQEKHLRHVPLAAYDQNPDSALKTYAKYNKEQTALANIALTKAFVGCGLCATIVCAGVLGTVWSNS